LKLILTQTVVNEGGSQRKKTGKSDRTAGENHGKKEDQALRGEAVRKRGGGQCEASKKKRCGRAWVYKWEAGEAVREQPSGSQT